MGQASNNNGACDRIRDQAGVLATTGSAFGDRPLNAETARRGLAMAAHDLILIELREVSQRKPR